MDWMDKTRKFVQETIGWVYPELKFLTKKEIELANRQRDALLKSISKEVRYSFRQNKILSRNIKRALPEGYLLMA